MNERPWWKKTGGWEAVRLEEFKGRQTSLEEAVGAGITPIEVMLSAMRELWDEGTPEAKREAAKIAKDAAPYVHPRLASIDQTNRETQQYVIYAPEPCLTTEEWEARVKAGRYDSGRVLLAPRMDID